MFNPQQFGTEQEALGVLRTALSAVCRVCPPGSIFGGFYLHVHVHLPFISIVWKEALPKGEISASLLRGQFPCPMASPNDTWQRSVSFGVVLMDFFFFSMQHSTGNGQGLQFSSVHSPSRSGDNFGLPAMDSCPWAKSPEVTLPFCLPQAPSTRGQISKKVNKSSFKAQRASLCWLGLQIKGNLVTRTYQVIINKHSFLYLIYLSHQKKFPRAGRSVLHELKCCPF